MPRPALSGYRATVVDLLPLCDKLLTLIALMHADRAAALDRSRPHSDLTGRIIKGFFEVYNDRGPGLPENAYRNALCVELQLEGLSCHREVSQEIVYKGVVVGFCRFDVVVEDRVLVEVKASKTLTDGDTRQVLTYLKISKYEVGLLLNFGPEPEPHRFVFANDRK